MSDKIKMPGTEMFDQALKNFDQAFQAGLKAQEDAFKGLLDCTGKMQPPKDWQKNWGEMVVENLPLAQKRIEESLQTAQQASRTSLELIKHAFEAGKIDNAAGAQAKMQELWEVSLRTIRSNAQTITQLNAKAIESWMQCAQKCVETPNAKARTA